MSGEGLPSAKGAPMSWPRLLASCLLLCLSVAHGQAARRSGFDFMSPATQAMQRDDMLNPAMLWLAQGQALWEAVDGKAGKSCASCHGAVAAAMRGAAPRYPAFDEFLQRPITLAQRIDQCRTRHQQASPWAAESAPRLTLEMLVAKASRGLPIAPPEDARLDAERDLGRRLFAQRFGQLDLACAQCHDGQAGRRLAGSAIPQAHPGGYPIYRLEWQGIGSLQRRLRGCMSGVRAEPFAFDAREWVALELYLMQRGAGLPIETPAVRP
jgi:L-cysteine S-thiosulfotransferase